MQPMNVEFVDAKMADPCATDEESPDGERPDRYGTHCNSSERDRADPGGADGRRADSLGTDGARANHLS